MGGHKYLCPACGSEIYIYHSCGHSQCPLCQSIKREQWQDTLGNRLLAVPYTHTVFTIPHQLNTIAKKHPRDIYNLLHRSAWQTVRKLCADPTNLGALPGMISVLHTFGSDMKYHLHVHSLITFGGTHKHRWVWPKRKKKIAPYRQMCNTFRTVFIKGLDQLIKKKIIKVSNYASLRMEVMGRRWNVRNSYPTAQTGLIENYLARYINRVAISRSRLRYLEEQRRVQIVYNDYRNQIKDQPAPKAVKYLHPLTAIHQILQHLLPPYFQKSRYYGLHAGVVFHKVKHKMATLVRHNGHTVRTIFQILKSLLGLNPLVCQSCQHPYLIKIALVSDPAYLHLFLSPHRLQPPPQKADV